MPDAPGVGDAVVGAGAKAGGKGVVGNAGETPPPKKLPLPPNIPKEGVGGANGWPEAGAGCAAQKGTGAGGGLEGALTVGPELVGAPPKEAGSNIGGDAGAGAEDVPG